MQKLECALKSSQSDEPVPVLEPLWPVSAAHTHVVWLVDPSVSRHLHIPPHLSTTALQHLLEIEKAMYPEFKKWAWWVHGSRKMGPML